MSEVDQFLAEHADFVLLENGKIRCSLTSHECKATIELLHEHVRGRKYAQALRDRAMTEKPIDLSRFDFIIQHVSFAIQFYPLRSELFFFALLVELCTQPTAPRLTTPLFSAKLAPYTLVTRHKKLKNKVYCKLTKFVLNKNEQEIGSIFVLLSSQFQLHVVPTFSAVPRLSVPPRTPRRRQAISDSRCAARRTFGQTCRDCPGTAASSFAQHSSSTARRLFPC